MLKIIMVKEEIRVEANSMRDFGCRLRANSLTCSVFRDPDLVMVSSGNPMETRRDPPGEDGRNVVAAS